MSMHTPQEWHQHSGFNMTQAQQSHRRAHSQNLTSRRAHDETVSENMGRYTALQESLEQKVTDSNRLIDMLQKRKESLQNSIQKTRYSLGLLEAAHQAKEPQVQLCLWRMAQREKRPLREQVRDNAETTLEQEKAVLIDTQKRLADAIKRTKDAIVGLENKLEDVKHDIEHKVQALGIDETCLRTTVRSYQTAVDYSRPSSNMNATIPAHRTTNARLSMHETMRNEMTRQQDAGRLAQAGSSREEKAKALRDENQLLIAKCQKAAEEAVAKTERYLQERVSENQQMRRKLEAEVRETKGKIEHTKDTISETKSKIRSLEEPMDNAATCASFRRQRATREHIHDPVSTKIQEHQMSTLRAHQDLVAHHAQEKANLQELMERLARLNEDLADKTSSQHIDQTCLTHATGNHTLPASFNYSMKGRHSARRSDLPSLPGSSTFPMLPMTAR